MRYLPLLLVVFQIPPFLSSGYPCTFEILPPFFIFMVSDGKHMEFWHEKVTSPHFKIQNGYLSKILRERDYHVIFQF